MATKKRGSRKSGPDDVIGSESFGADARHASLRRKIAGGGAFLSIAGWSTPVVDSVLLPAHAQTTGPDSSTTPDGGSTTTGGPTTTGTGTTTLTPGTTTVTTPLPTTLLPTTTATPTTTDVP